MVNYLRLDQSYTFITFSFYQCNNNCLYLVYQHIVNSSSIRKSFPTTYQLERREIKKNAIPRNKAKHDLLQLLWVYQDVRATQLNNIPLTDLITY